MNRSCLAALAGLTSLLTLLGNSTELRAQRPLPAWAEYHSSTILQHGWLAWARGDLRAAEAAARRAELLEPNGNSAILLLTTLQVEQERWKEATLNGSRLAASGEQSADISLLLGRIAVEQGHWGAARNHYQRVLRRHPKDARGELGLALVAARGPRDWKEMRARLATATRLQPGFSAAILPLTPGWKVLADDEEFLRHLGSVLESP